MSTSRRVPATLSLLLVFAATTAFAAPQPEALHPESSTAQLDTYQKSTGEAYFALSLRPPRDLPHDDAHDVALLFDTSASQVGPYRDKALAALEKLLAELGPHDRVALLAVDLRAVPLSPGFVRPGSPEMKAALAKLRKRVPLGSTDMAAGMAAVSSLFDESPVSGRAAVYIGDGMSKANLLGSEAFRDVVGRLALDQIAVSSYAIGPQVDSRLLAALANQTGGNLAVDGALAMTDEQQGVTQARAAQENTRQARQVGTYLAAAARGVVLWPTSAAWPKGFSEVLPSAVPPLRSDRDTVVLGVGRVQNPVDVVITAKHGDQSIEMRWKVEPTRPSDDHAYLAQLVEMARRDGGMTLPTVGREGLSETRRLVQSGVKHLTNLARQAVATGDSQNAQVLAEEVLKRDPGNPTAKAIQGTARKLRVKLQAGPTGPAASDLRLVQAVPDARDGELLDEVAREGSFIDVVEQQNRIITLQIQAEVEAALKDARNRMGTDPDAIIRELKLTLDSVRRAPELDPDVRARLVDQIESTLKEASRRQLIHDEQLQEAEAAAAQAREERLLADRLIRREEKIKQLMDRMASLVAEGRFREAEEEAGAEVAALDPQGDVPVAAVLTARLMRRDYENSVIRTARWKGYWETMEQVERSSIPFPDEPPIVYPDAPVWEELTHRRKKYASVDLKRRGGAEEEINLALDENTTLEFIETPLQDVVEYLKDLHGIEIQLDRKALDDVGIGTDTPITRNLKGISLRSALRLMLRELDLTYLIQDEVLSITTPEQVENSLTTKVYPVADLVLPIPQNSFGGLGGMMGGGGGGMGGGGGGMGGGMGGGGMGGGMGGMGGGGGGGFFSVPDDGKSEPASADLRLFKSTAKNVPQVAASQRPEKPVTSSEPQKEVAPLAVDKSQPAAEFWDEQFSKQVIDPRAVRATVRQLLEEKNLDQVMALCQAALRHGQPQSWMYETLGLAMEATGQPKEELERTLMSAADFGAGVDELMYVGQYLARIGLDQRALEVYRQAAKLEPLRPEPYTLAMSVARRLDDVEGIQWATVGVLSQAWTSDNAALVQSATRSALAMLERLKNEKRHDQYAAYKQQLDEAVVRDLVVLVSWTGQADVDLMVEEPTGTICSLRSPRTTAGGVMLGDVIAGFDQAPTHGYTEAYVCPAGFDGTYRLALRRVWGKVTAGKVTVDIYSGFRSQSAQHLRKQIEVGEDDAVIAVDLKQGRREEPLEEHRIANAAANQVALGRAVLAQHLNALADPRIASEIARRRGTLAGDPRLFGSSAVGFQPVIITLPEGTNFQVTGVISADRRYVRITPTPIFSGIGDVTTFTFAGAAQQVDPIQPGNGNGAGAGAGVGGGAGANVGGGGGGVNVGGAPGAGVVPIGVGGGANVGGGGGIPVGGSGFF